MSRSNFYKNYYQSFMNENMNPLYRRYLEYLSSDLPDVSDIGGFIDVPTTAEREGLESLLDTTEDVRTPLGPMAPMNQQREGGGGPRGIGVFGNLDKDSLKYFKDKSGNIIKGYRNINSGLFQTEDGQNIIGLDEYESISSGSIDRPYGVPDMIGSSTSPSVISAMTNVPGYGLRSLTNPFDLQAKQIFAKNLEEKQAQEEAERKAKEEAEKKAAEAAIEKAKNEREAQEKIKEEIRRKDLEDMRGGVGRNDDRQTERQQAGPGYDNIREAGSF